MPIRFEPPLSVYRSLSAGSIDVEHAIGAGPSDGGRATWDKHVLQLHLGAPMWCRQRHAGEVSEHTFRRGHLTLIPAGVDAQCFRKDSVSFARLLLPAECFAAAGLGAWSPDRALHCFTDPVIRELIASILDTLIREGESSLCYVQSATRVVALRLEQQTRQRRSASTVPERALLPAKHGLSETRLRRVLARLHDALDENPSVTELAGVAGLETAHFSRMFKRSTGLAPHQYLQRLRLERAQTLLRHTNQSITQIALSLGFSNPSHFSSFYRQHTGVLPRAERRKAQALR